MFVVWLFIAMGLPWTLDLVSGYLHDRENDAIILLIDMVTALQGFMIFLIYNLKFGLWNKLVGFLKMRKKLMEKTSNKKLTAVTCDQNTDTLQLNSRAG